MRAAGWRCTRSIFNAAILSSPFASGKLFSRAPSGTLIQARADTEDVPPPDLWLGYADDEAGYLESGRRDAAIILDAVASHSAAAPAVVLDFGCAAGRVLRFFPRTCELWGVDISGRHIDWCQRNLPDLNFATTTTEPHLPFEDGYFDLVYCASVFTHISDLADSWLLELRRILKPAGLAYITVHDIMSYRLLFTKYASEPSFKSFVEQVRRFESANHALDQDLEMFWFGADPGSQVFYDREFLLSKWSKWMDVIAYHPQVHDHQSAIILRRR